MKDGFVKENDPTIVCKSNKLTMYQNNLKYMSKWYSAWHPHHAQIYFLQYPNMFT